ncbi:MAG: PEP-CTERM sorting domain-containing protein, partial [Betaproteobacteria bacterium]|nr:PEP-CTERM sorting domain-containing protein [Betaproteobacteria bacterium]
GESAVGSNHGLPDGEELLNEGEISAAQAELNASGNIYALAIRNNGTIRAKAVVANADGTVRLDGGLGDVQNTGTLIAKNAGDDATAAGGIFGFDASYFDILSTKFSNPLGSPAGSWSVTQSGNSINLNYATAIPEPTTGSLLLVGLLGALAARRRRS